MSPSANGSEWARPHSKSNTLALDNGLRYVRRMDNEPDDMPEGIHHWISGYLYARGILEPTPEQFEDAVSALARYRNEFPTPAVTN